MSEPGDDELLAQLVAGREDAFAALYDRYGLALYRVAFALLASRESAEDAAEESGEAAVAGNGAADEALVVDDEDALGVGDVLDEDDDEEDSLGGEDLLVGAGVDSDTDIDLESSATDEPEETA